MYRFSTSSASSQGTVELLAEGVNPFQPAIVNMMLNKAGGSERITVIMEEAPDVMSGCMLVLKGVKYACVGVDREVGLTKHCTLRQDDLTLKTLKVHTHSPRTCSHITECVCVCVCVCVYRCRVGLRTGRYQCWSY